MKACNIYFSEGCDGNKEKRGEKTGNNKFKDLLKKKRKKENEGRRANISDTYFPQQAFKILNSFICRVSSSFHFDRKME